MVAQSVAPFSPSCHCSGSREVFADPRDAHAFRYAKNQRAARRFGFAQGPERVEGDSRPYLASEFLLLCLDVNIPATAPQL